MTRTRKPKEIVDIDSIPGYDSPAAALAGLPSVSGHLQPEPEEYDEDDVTTLNKVLDELGSDGGEGGFVTVFREIPARNGGKREDEYIDRFDASEFTLADLKDRCGPGRYKISVYRPGGKGLATRKTINIAGSPVSAAPAPVQSGNSDMAMMLAAMQEGFKGLGQLIVQSRPQEASRADMLKEMVVMKELFASPQSAAPTQNYDPVSLLKLGIEMGNGGGVESNNSWVDKMLETFGPMLASTMLAGKSELPASAAPRAALPAPATSRPAEPVNPPANQPEEEPMNVMLKAYMKMMLNAAIQNQPVEEYADQVINLLPASQLVEVEGMLRADTWMASLTNLLPQAPQYSDWFARLRDTILQYIDEDRAIAGQSVLTPVAPGVSVHSHENGNTPQSGQIDGNSPVNT